MNTHTPVAPIALKISDISVRQDDQGRYCINDLHKASGHLGRHQPSNWLRTQPAQDLIAELEKDVPHIRGTSKDDTRIPVSKIQGNGKQQGTYIVKELAIAYAMWISASFSLKVIRAYDALQQSSEPVTPLPTHPLQTKLLVVIDGSSTVPFCGCIVNPDDPVAVATFIREFVPSTPEMLSALSSAYITKLTNCWDVAIKSAGEKKKS